MTRARDLARAHGLDEDQFRALDRVSTAAIDNVEPAGVPLILGAVVDTETTGLDHEKDEVIELAAIPFAYDPAAGVIYRTGEPLHEYQEPREPISADITALTGITNETVKGRTFDREKIAAFVQVHRALIVAHGAHFDRPFCERITDAFERTNWACSMNQIPWTEANIRGRSLEFINFKFGFFYEAHNAVTDCHALLNVLTEQLPGRTALMALLNNARQPSRRVWAIGAEFNAKGALKGRGYFWNNGDDGRPKAWHREVSEAAWAAEYAWLVDVVYRHQSAPVRCTPITPRNRFTNRD